MHLHRWRWKDVRRRLTGPPGRWRWPTAKGIELFAKVPFTRYRYRGSKFPSRWAPATTSDGGCRGEPLPGDRHGGFGERPGERTVSNHGTALQADSTSRHRLIRDGGWVMLSWCHDDVGAA